MTTGKLGVMLSALLLVTVGWLETVVLSRPMTTSELVAWTVAATTVIAAIGREVVNAITAWRKVDQVTEKLDRAADKLDTNTTLTKETADKLTEVNAKADVIGGHVNSTSTLLATENRGLQAQVELLKTMLASEQETSRKMAAASAAQAAVASSTVVQVAEAISKKRDNE